MVFNQNRPHSRLGSKCDLKMQVRNLMSRGLKSPKNRWLKTTFFRRFRNLAATLTAYIFGTKHDIHNRLSALTTTRGLLYDISSQKCHELWSANGFKLDRHFNPLYLNSAFYFITRLRRRRSANGTQSNFAKRRTVNRANICRRKVWVTPPYKIGSQKTLTRARFFFNDFET